MSIASAELGGKCGDAAVIVKSEGRKQQAIVDIVKSLQTVIGNDEKDMLGELGMLGHLGNSLPTLSGPEMKTVAANMAKAAKAALETTRVTCDGRCNDSYAQARQ